MWIKIHVWVTERPDGKCLEVTLKTSGSVTTDTAGGGPTAGRNTRFCHQKQPETTRLLEKNTHKHYRKWPDIPYIISGSITTNSAGKCPVVILESAGFVNYKLGWKRPQVSLKTPGSVATNTRDNPTSGEKFSQTRQEISRGLLQHTQIQPPQTGCSCAEVSLKNIQF